MYISKLNFLHCHVTILLDSIMFNASIITRTISIAQICKQHVPSRLSPLLLSRVPDSSVPKRAWHARLPIYMAIMHTEKSSDRGSRKPPAYEIALNLFVHKLWQFQLGMAA